MCLEAFSVDQVQHRVESQCGLVLRPRAALLAGHVLPPAKLSGRTETRRANKVLHFGLREVTGGHHAARSVITAAGSVALLGRSVGAGWLRDASRICSSVTQQARTRWGSRMPSTVT